MIRCTLADLEKRLVPILEELMTSDLERRPFVVVEEPLTKRFVQYIRRYKPKTGELLFDVPALGIVLQPCTSPVDGAQLAFATMRGRFELPYDAEFTIQVDGDPTN
jgi:hypothetical protein